jgi:hypothetical protein
MSSKGMNWRRVHFETRIRDHGYDSVATEKRVRQPRQAKKVPVRVDQEFWRAWHGDRRTMLAAGYRVAKIDGRWQAWSEFHGAGRPVTPRQINQRQRT